jgi:hypothetical protein
MRPKPVEVHWLDSSADGGWHTAEETLARARAMPCTSVGYLLHRDTTTVVLVQSHSPEEGERLEQWADALTIPASTVKKVRALK